MNDNIRADRDSAMMFVSLAEDFLNNNSLNEAEEYCNLALSQFPDLQEAQELLARIKERQGSPEPSAEAPHNAPEPESPSPAVNTPLPQAKAETEEKKEKEPAEPVKPASAPAADIIGQARSEDRMLSANETEDLLDNALSDINNLNGVLGSIIIEESGLIIKSSMIQNLDPEITAALFSTIFIVSEDSMSKVDIGDIDRIFIELGKVRIYLFKGNGYILGIFTEEIVKIGLVLVKAKHLLKNIKQVLE